MPPWCGPGVVWAVAYLLKFSPAWVRFVEAA